MCNTKSNTCRENIARVWLFSGSVVGRKEI